MGVSTNGQICFGIYFEEDAELPWDESGDSLDEWWIEESGWVWEGDNPYTSQGEYTPGFCDGDPRIDTYYNSRTEWKKSHPCPIVDVNYQSGDYPAYILAVPSTIKTANRGYPKVFSPGDLIVSLDEEKALLDFCNKYGLEYDTPPSWYLSSYWG